MPGEDTAPSLNSQVTLSQSKEEGHRGNRNTHSSGRQLRVLRAGSVPGAEHTTKQKW